MRKSKGYWNYENCENAAKTCRNRRDFYLKYSTAGLISRRNGWINDFDKFFSTEKQFYGFEDKIHCVYVYIIKKHNAVYVGRTINIKRRDSQHRYYENDSLKDFCMKHNVAIPQPDILVENINALESRDLEDYYTEKYRNDGWYVINKAKTGKHSGSLGSTVRIWTYEHCKKVALECDSKEDYRAKYPTAHRVATVNHWINDFLTMYVSLLGILMILRTVKKSH